MLLEVLRELVVVAAAAGVAAATWTWLVGRTSRDQELGAARSRAEAQARDLKAGIAGLETRIEAIGDSVSALARHRQDEELRWPARIAIHALLQGTRDPFLSFEEIENALAGSEQKIAGDVLRRHLMEMVTDGVIAQLDRDRYFIASDFEAGDSTEGTGS